MKMLILKSQAWLAALEGASAGRLLGPRGSSIDRRSAERPPARVEPPIGLIWSGSRSQRIFRQEELNGRRALGFGPNPRMSQIEQHASNVAGFSASLEYVALGYHVLGSSLSCRAPRCMGPRRERAVPHRESAAPGGAVVQRDPTILSRSTCGAVVPCGNTQRRMTVILRPPTSSDRSGNAPSDYLRPRREFQRLLAFDPIMQVVTPGTNVLGAITKRARGLGVPRDLQHRRPLACTEPPKLVALETGRRRVANPARPRGEGAAAGYGANGANVVSKRRRWNHLRYVCMVDDRRARRSWAKTRTSTNLAATVRAVNDIG